MAQATIRDVAREADVSVASVSRALNGHSNVRPELRLHIETVAAALGYVPHAGARNLSMARANAIGVVLPDLHGEFFSETLRGMDRAASERGLQLLLSNLHDGDRAVRMLHTMRGRVDGLIIMAPHIDPDLLLAGLPPSIPAVLVNCDAPGKDRPTLRVDNVAGARTMTEHLIATGRREIVHLSGPDSNAEARERIAGYRAAMEAAGLAPHVVAGDFMQETGVALTPQILRDYPTADAIFAANDMMALGVLIALRAAGIDVPGRIALAGFDDVPLSRLISPALTTMHVDIAGIGARAIARLTEAIAGSTDHALEVSLPELMIRETTK
ncbi:LacI family DNA-binding transcriptional regulator [Sphingomonas sp. PAMC 26617]|uniref:LacI family DNA-binding transcriptional regulator n=1 Tax=Sphingomonas sp. PAMC 26617 TaxID=1112216 RepID=UPI00028812CF|nr:LacI family DNA-binding transcriptional regulator [Sphingomonas sp. PAMC 26617]